MKTQENLTQKNKTLLWVTNSAWVIIVLIILLLKTCSDEKKKREYQTSIDVLKNKIDSLQNIVNEKANQKTILITEREIINGKSGTKVSIDTVPMNYPGESEKFLQDVIKKISVKVPVPIECPECPELTVDSCLEKVCLDSIANDSIIVCLDKQYREDSVVIMMQRREALKDFILNDYPPSINYTNTYIEYLPNPYRKKAEYSFKRSLISGGGAAVIYGGTELMGHAFVWENKDNSKAELKSNLIIGTRVVVAGLAAYSLFEFGRTIYFHKMEGKFIVNPTQIGLILYLDKPAGK